MYLTTGTALDLDIELIKTIKSPRTMILVRENAIFQLLADIERQLSDEEREKLRIKHDYDEEERETKKKDQLQKCGTDLKDCDGGIDCKERTRPSEAICRVCLCSSCIRGKCQGKTR